MTTARSRLDDAYRATTYRVFVSAGQEPVDLHIGEVSPRLDELLASHGLESWAFITAWNPASLPLPAEANNKRHAELLQLVRDRGWRFCEGSGIPGNPDWEPERSLLVLGISKDEAIALGKRFEQNAIVTGQRGEKAQLVYCT